MHQSKANLRILVGDYEDRAIRPLALGKFRDLLAATLHHPAMLRYLDNSDNAVGHINENYAREIMELHTMGVGRPTLGIARPDVGNPNSALPLGAEWGLHPVLRDSILPLWGRREVAFVPFAGTSDDLTRSHFETQDTIELGQSASGSRDYRSGFMTAANRGAVSPRGFELSARRIGRLMREQFNLGFVDVGGWDTHVNQGAATGYLADRLGELGRALAGFSEEIGPAGWRDAVVVVISEFGRTFRENGDRGTDHGHGSVYWVMGGGINGGRILGEQVKVDQASLFRTATTLF